MVIYYMFSMHILYGNTYQKIIYLRLSIVLICVSCKLVSTSAYTFEVNINSYKLWTMKV